MRSVLGLRMISIPSHSPAPEVAPVHRTLLGWLAALSAVLLTAVWGACGQPDVPPAVESAMEIERGIGLLEDGHIEQARAAFGSAIHKDGQNAEAYARRGFVSLALNDARGAMADLDRALALDPDLALGLQLQRSGLRDGGQRRSRHT